MNHPGYIAIDFGCGCHWKVYRISGQDSQMVAIKTFDSKAEAVAAAREYNIEGGGYAPSIMPGQYDGLTPAERAAFRPTAW